MASETVLIYEDKEQGEYFRFSVETIKGASNAAMARAAEEALWQYLKKEHFEEGDDEDEFYARFDMVCAAHGIENPHSIHFMN